MLMNIATLLINHLLGRASESDSNQGFFPRFNLVSVRKLMMILVGLAASWILFFGGYLTILLDLTLTSRDHNQLMLSPASIVGFALIGLSVLAMAGLLSRKLWKLNPQQLRPESHPSPSPVQDAMADLIRDFVEERRMARELAAHQFAAQSAAAQASTMTAEMDMAQSETLQQAKSHPAFN